MKFLGFFFFFSSFYLSQNQKLNFVQYFVKNSNGYADVGSTDAILLFNEADKIYFVPYIIEGVPYKTIDFDKINNENLYKNTDVMVYQSINDNRIFENKYDFIKNKIYLTSDNFNFLWDLKKEFKDILGYKCQKAQANFRGRIWTVWFTDQIPTQFAPWKFHGLPGLILEAKDNYSLFEYKAVKIILNSDYKFNNDMLDFFSYKDRIIDYRKFIDVENRNIKSLNERVNASFPAGTVFLDKDKPLRNLKPEITFEWEESKKP